MKLKLEKSKTVTIPELVVALQSSGYHDVAADDLKQLIDDLFGAIRISLIEGHQVKIHLFGTFQVKMRASRKGFSRIHGAVMTKARRRPVFSASEVFVNMINKDEKPIHQFKKTGNVL